DVLLGGNAALFGVPALLGTLFFVGRLVLMLVAGDGDLHQDVGIHVDAGTGDVSGHTDSSSAFKILSLQAVAAFLMGFGWGGLGIVRGLADNLVIHYRVQTGEDGAGFVAGRATYIWHSRDGRYSLVSTLEATGLAALFISGRIVQVSEGTVDGAGLHPAQYHLQRNERKQDVARFGWSQNRLTMEGRPGVALTPQAQDLLSFPFHLAMTVREGEGDFTLGVTNGRKFNEFAFRVVGREVIDVAGRQLNTLHLHGEKTAEGTLDVWLDMDRSGLPVKVRTYDRKGKVAMMQLEGVETPGRDSGE
ncbi:MAG: DUF3108 domain-containing protein, partial [Thiobacillus sp.]|nr:DUF3108 domain-containing protein [Thiobacillus sp.]